MPDILEGPSPLRIEYRVSLAHSLLATIGLVCAVPCFEGLGDWLRETRARMPDDLLSELCLLVTFPGKYQRFTAELTAHLPVEAFSLSFDQLMMRLDDIPGADYQLIALQALARGATPPPPPSELLRLLDNEDRWAAYLDDIASKIAPEVVAALVRDGDKLKTRLLTTLDRFWHEFYADTFKATRSLMERSVAHHRAQRYTPRFPDLFTTITGRLVPEGLAELLPAISTVTFIPSCHVGPYVAYTHHGDKLNLFYNCLSTPASPDAVDSASLYPPLKALADETRLQILALLRERELYAQEIVDQLDISQPAVSRHLNLMAAAGVLKTRREGNAKYFAIDKESLIRVADALRAFV
ncbi:MAG: metalloregulator ArsR/SmtB family transcription factor [Anaerolineae bacterium]|jgi:DNA-binding transcriptional ArsR family regulator